MGQTIVDDDVKFIGDVYLNVKPVYQTNGKRCMVSRALKFCFGNTIWRPCGIFVFCSSCFPFPYYFIPFLFFFAFEVEFVLYMDGEETLDIVEQAFRCI